MNMLSRIASTLGEAYREFRQASGMQTPGQAKRPQFLSGMAEQEKWKGGEMGAKDAAYKRSLMNSWVYTAINFKASEMASGRLYIVQNQSGLEEDAVPVTQHPFLQVLKRPNPLMGRGYLWRYTHWWLDLSGNSYWFLAPDEDGNLAEIWPMPANLVNPFPGDQNRMVDYYEYQVNGQIWPVPAEYVCHFKYPNPFDYYRGLAPLVAALLAADSDSAMAFWNGAFFGQNNTMPSAIISLSSGNPNQPIDPQDVEAVKEQLHSEFAANARNTVVTNAYDMAVQLLGWNAKDMDFFNGRSFSRDEIYGIYGMPAGMFDKSATEANSTTADNVFKEKTLWPLMTNIYADSITAQIMPHWYSTFDEARFEDVRPINRAMRIQEANAALTDMTRAERRARFWNLGKLENDELNNEIPGRMQNTPAPAGINTIADQNPAFPGDPLNAAPTRTLSLETLEDLRRWKEVAIKSVKAGKPASLHFVSQVIPGEIKNALTAALTQARTVEQVREAFKTIINPAPAGGLDDPNQRVKTAAALEMEKELNEYFASLAQRIAEQAAQ